MSKISYIVIVVCTIVGGLVVEGCRPRKKSRYDDAVESSSQDAIANTARTEQDDSKSSAVPSQSKQDCPGFFTSCKLDADAKAWADYQKYLQMLASMKLPPPPPDACDSRPLICAPDLRSETTFCIADTYDQTMLPPANYFAGWGDTECLARENLRRRACDALKRFDLVAGIRCGPDTSGGECPSEDVICTAQHDPTVCVASKYDGQTVDPSFGLRATGNNECIARSNLIKLACVLGMQPSKFGSDIECIKT